MYGLNLQSTIALKQTKADQNICRIELVVGEAVDDLLSDEGFQTDWDKLYESCPWATVYQSRAFVTTWYKTYQKQYLPIIVIYKERDYVTGLFTLAKDNGKLIFVAGKDQAEYQAWLATENNGEVFIKKALTAVRKHFSGNKIQINYIPSKAPMKWVEHPFFKKHCFLRAFKQPLMKTAEVNLSDKLRQKQRERINRLKKKGELQLEHIKEDGIFSSILDTLAIQFDFRKIALYNTALFQDDPLRKKFILALFDKGLLHVAALKLNGELIATSVSVTGKSWVHLTFNTHAFPYAKYSPGIVHFHLLGKLLSEEGIAVFDLTPGGDLYKDRLATDFTEAYYLIFSSTYSCLTNYLKFKIVSQLKVIVSGIGLNPSTAKKEALVLIDKLKLFRKQGLIFAIKNIISTAISSKKVRKYIAPANLLNPSIKLSINKNSLSDLLQYEAKGKWMTRWEFLEDAMNRFEKGQSIYTFCEKDRLLCCVWLNDEADLLQEFYCHPLGQTILKSFLTAVTTAVACHHKKNKAYAIVAAKDKVLCKTLEAIGFQKADHLTT